MKGLAIILAGLASVVPGTTAFSRTPRLSRRAASGANRGTGGEGTSKQHAGGNGGDDEDAPSWRFAHHAAGSPSSHSIDSEQSSEDRDVQTLLRHLRLGEHRAEPVAKESRHESDVMGRIRNTPGKDALYKQLEGLSPEKRQQIFDRSYANKDKKEAEAEAMGREEARRILDQQQLVRDAQRPGAKQSRKLKQAFGGPAEALQELLASTENPNPRTSKKLQKLDEAMQKHPEKQNTLFNQHAPSLLKEIEEQTGASMEQYSHGFTQRRPTNDRLRQKLRDRQLAEELKRSGMTDEQIKQRMKKEPMRQKERDYQQASKLLEKAGRTPEQKKKEEAMKETKAPMSVAELQEKVREKQKTDTVKKSRPAESGQRSQEQIQKEKQEKQQAKKARQKERKQQQQGVEGSESHPMRGTSKSNAGETQASGGPSQEQTEGTQQKQEKQRAKKARQKEKKQQQQGGGGSEGPPL